TSDVLKVISRSTFDLQPVFEIIVETAARLCNADTANITNREGNCYRSVASYAASPEYHAFTRSRLLPVDRGTVTGRTALEGQVAHIHDIASDREYAVPETVTVAKVRTALARSASSLNSQFGSRALTGRQSQRRRHECRHSGCGRRPDPADCFHS